MTILEAHVDPFGLVLLAVALVAGVVSLVARRKGWRALSIASAVVVVAVLAIVALVAVMGFASGLLGGPG